MNTRHGVVSPRDPALGRLLRTGTRWPICDGHHCPLPGSSIYVVSVGVLMGYNSNAFFIIQLISSDF
jgi:hypothetical protein